MGKFTRLFRNFSYEPFNTNNPPPAGEEAVYQPPEEIFSALEKNISVFERIFHRPQNADFITREFICAGTQGAIVYMDGLVNRINLEDMVLKPLMRLQKLDARPSQYADLLVDRHLPSGNAMIESHTMKIVQQILGGNSVILLDGCPKAIICEMQGVTKRSIDQPVAENVVVGPHQSFNENLRTNLGLLRSIIKSPNFVNEMVYLGNNTKSPASICYMQNIANPSLVKEVKRRLNGINKDIVLNAGEIVQLIEDKPFAMLPQMIMTERPDRAASFMMDGMVIILYDNSPHAIGAPATIFHFLHTSEDSFVRWQYGSFLRFIRITGAMTAMLMPALYNALLLFHQELLPGELLTSLIEGHALVPFPVTAELVLMILVFDLINEASLRMPGYMGSTLGIIGALVLGQAAVSANLISPALIIVISITGLGTFTVPDYSLSLALRIRRLFFVLGSSLFGFMGIALVSLVTLFIDCGLESFGVPVFAPLAPVMPHNPDTILRLPIFLQRIIPVMFRPKQKMAAADPRGWTKEKSDNE